MTVHEAITAAEAHLPGVAAPEGATDPRWQHIIAIGDFIESQPEEVWQFAQRWGRHEDDDLRSAVATCLLEHLLEHHFALIFPRVEELSLVDPRFADTFTRCSKFGQSLELANTARFDGLGKRLFPESAV